MKTCPHRPPCPGCPRYGQRGLAPEARRALDALAHECGLPAPVLIEGPPFGWRHRARLAVRGRAGSPKIGLFEAGTHRIVDTPRCPIHHPLVNRVAGVLRHALRETRTPPYRDDEHRGLVRYLQVVVERLSQRAQVVLVCRGDDPTEIEAAADIVQSELGESLHSLWWNGQPERTNTIVGPRWHRMVGAESVRERIGDVDVHFPPGAFGQANLELAERMVEIACSWLAGSGTIADIYAGCGALGLPMLARGDRVQFAERGRDSLRGLELGLRGLPPDARARASVHSGDVGASAGLAEALHDCRSVVVDPPRRGIDPHLLGRLANDPPERLAYVSCGLPAFLLQARSLLRGRRLRLGELQVMALFPHTDHVETLALFERV